VPLPVAGGSAISDGPGPGDLSFRRRRRPTGDDEVDVSLDPDPAALVPPANLVAAPIYMSADGQILSFCN
jgi:hypothetical protein